MPDWMSKVREEVGDTGPKYFNSKTGAPVECDCEHCIARRRNAAVEVLNPDHSPGFWKLREVDGGVHVSY